MNDKLASFIDHTLLKPEATRAEIDKLLQEAIEHEFAAVSVNAYWVTYCRDQVKETNVQVCTVIGFPLGATTTEPKVFEAKQAVATAGEVDFVKTSTGFSGGGASVADIKLMRETVGPDIGVKASGGVRDFETARDMIDAGATRIGASAGIKIVQEAR